MRKSFPKQIFLNSGKEGKTRQSSNGKLYKIRFSTLNVQEDIMKKLRIVLTVLACILSLSLAANSFASEGDQMKGSPMMEEKGSVAIDGNCPVCIIGGKVVDGNKNFATEYKGKVYYFVGFDQQKMFINDPETYIAGLEKKYKELKEQSKGADMQKGSYNKGS